MTPVTRLAAYDPWSLPAIKKQNTSPTTPVTRLATYAPWALPALKKQNSKRKQITRFAAYDWYDVPKPPPPVHVVFTPNPATDTIRGGAQIAVSTNVITVDPAKDVSFLSQTLPANWTTTKTGSGQISTSHQGTTLTSGPFANSSVQLSSPTVYLAFDATLSFIPKLPVSATTNPVNICTFTFKTLTSSVQIRARKLANVSGNSLYVDTLVSFPESLAGVSSGGIILPSDNLNSPVLLEIVRWQNYVFCFVNSTLIYTTNRFSMSPGNFQISCDNGINSIKTSSVISTVTVRSQTMIVDKKTSLGLLFQNKIDFAPRKIVGTVPPTTLSEVGFHDIIVFGPWGYADITSGFEYTLPNGKTIGTDLVMYSDPDVIDKSNSNF